MAQRQPDFAAALRRARQLFRDERAAPAPDSWALRTWRGYQWALLADWYRAKHRAVKHAPSCPWGTAPCDCGADERRLVLERGQARCARRAAPQEEVPDAA